MRAASAGKSSPRCSTPSARAKASSRWWARSAAARPCCAASWSAQLPDTIDSVYLGNPTLEPDDMLAAILADLGIDTPESGRQARLAQLNATLLARHQAGRRVVVFVEEAQGIALDNLEFLRLLTNLETATDKLLQIVLFGQPELDVQLADPRIRQLKDRITLSLNLSPLTRARGRRLPARPPFGGGLSRPRPVSAVAHRAHDAALRRPVAPHQRAGRQNPAGGLCRANPHPHPGPPGRSGGRRRHAAPPVQPATRPGLRRWAWLSAGLAAGLGLLAFVAWQALSLTAPPPVPLPTRTPAAPACCRTGRRCGRTGQANPALARHRRAQYPCHPARLG